MYKILLLFIIIFILYKNKSGFTNLKDKRKKISNTRYNSYYISNYMSNDYLA